MFCKWCGATLPNTAGKCPRCGKEAPVLSDCGGFYDLVPAAKQPPATLPGQPSELPKADPPNAVAPKTDPPPKAAAPQTNLPPQTRNQPARKKNILPLLIACVCFLLIIAFLLSMNSKLERILRSYAQQDERIDEISKDLSQVKDSIPETAPEQTTPKQTTPPLDTTTKPDELRLGDQDVKIEITVDHTDEGSFVKTMFDLDDFEDTAVSRVMFDKATQSLVSVQIDLGETESYIDVTVNHEPAASTSGFDRGLISVDFEVDDLSFAEPQNYLGYEWFYRIDNSSEWQRLDNNLFQITNSKDGTSVNYLGYRMEDLVKDSTMVEFQVTYHRNNTEGGSLTVVISGIAVTCQPFDAQTTPAN